MVILKHEHNEKVKMDGISESEKKRLESLKQKKEVFRVKELAVQNALKNLDNKSNKNKIIFDDDIDKLEPSKIKKKEKEKKRKRNLFDDDNNDADKDDEQIWDTNKFEIKKNITRKFYRQNVTLGNDERFKIDERFIEDEQKSDEIIIAGNSDKTDLQKEKELQLDILEHILGEPITSKNENKNKDIKFAKIGMIRYDPTDNTHKEYEINTEQPEPETKKIKKKKKSTKDDIEDNNGNPPVEVSKDVYFSVSDSLSKSLKEGTQFSLLGTYKKETNDKKEDNNDNVTNNEPLKPPKYQFNFNSKNPFKYDSSDDEQDSKQDYVNNKQQMSNVMETTNNFFFDSNDVRFNEAKEFFSKSYTTEGTFKELRQELKQIVRSKIRRNIKKKQPWGYKKKIKRPS